MAKFINTSINSTGYKLETVPGVAETLTSADYVGKWSRSPIKPISESSRIDIGNNIGAAKVVPVSLYGEITLTGPLSDGDFVGAFKTAGGVVENGSIYWGGNYAKVSGTNSGLLNTSAVTFEHYDGRKKYVLYGAKPSSLKISHEVKKEVTVEAVFQGLFTNSNSETINYRQTPPSTFNVNTKGTLSLSGINFLYTNVEVDIKPNCVMIENATSANGYSQAEITSVDPTISVTVYPGDPAIGDLVAMYLNRTPVDFIWTFGTGTGNTYTFSGKVTIDTKEDADINSIVGTTLTLIPVINDNYSLKLTIA